MKQRARQIPLPLGLPPAASRFEDRGHGTYETRGQRQGRLKRERQAHEQRIARERAAAPYLANVHLRRIPE